MNLAYNSGRRLALLIFCIASLALMIFAGCKASNNVMVRPKGTNLVVVMPSNSSLVTITNNPGGITITNVGGGGSATNVITVTNEFGTNGLLPVVVTVSNALVTNEIKLDATVHLTNEGKIVAKCDCGTNGGGNHDPQPPNGCGPISCWLRELIDHHLKEIISFISSLVGLTGVGVVGAKIAKKELSPEQKASLIKFGILAAAIVIVSLVCLFWHPDNSTNRRYSAPATKPSSGNDMVEFTDQPDIPPTNLANAEISQSIRGLAVAVDRLGNRGETVKCICKDKSDDGKAGFSKELSFSLLTAIVTAGWYFYRKYREEKSIRVAVDAEIDRLREVVQKHAVWIEKCIEAGDTDGPLIPFSYPVFAKQVENIGVYREPLAGRAVKFYGWIEYLNKYQATRKEFEASKGTPAFLKAYYGSLRSFLDERF